jgi:hypothetical protein
MSGLPSPRWILPPVFAGTIEQRRAWRIAVYVALSLGAR